MRRRSRSGCRSFSVTILAFVLSLALIYQPIALAADSVQAVPVLTVVGLEGLLDNLQGRLDAIINHAANEVRDIVRVLADQISTEIAAARQMLHTELEFQQQLVMSHVNSMINNIRNSVDALEQNAFALVHDSLNQAQLIAMTIPFSRRDPMLKGYDPAVAFPSGAPTDTFRFSVFGVFADAGRPGYEPTLELTVLDSAGAPHAQTFPASSPTQVASQFLVPNALLFAGPQVIRRISGKLHVPFRKRFLLLFHRRTDRVFPLTIGLLPNSPGALRISFTNTSEVWDSQVNTSYVMQQNASQGDEFGWVGNYFA